MSMYYFTLFLLFSAYAARAEWNGRASIDTNRVFPDRAFRNVLRKADEFFGSLTAAKAASASNGAKLEELRIALTKPGKKGPAAILLPSGWDKNSIVDVLSKSLSQSKQLDDLSERFNRFMEEIKRLEKLKNGGDGELRNGTNGLILQSNQPLTLDSLSNSTVMGKLVGFIQTGRNVGSFQLSDFFPCSNGSCDKLSIGMKNIRNFLAKETDRFIDLFRNSDALRKIADDQNENSTSSTTSISTSSSSSSSNDGPDLTTQSSETARSPVDYFDDYYNQEWNADGKRPSIASTNKKTNHTNIKINHPKKKANASTNNAKQAVDYFDDYYNQEWNADGKRPSTASTNKKTNHTNIKINHPKKKANASTSNAKQAVDYFDYYYNQGIPAIIGDKSKFDKNKKKD